VANSEKCGWKINVCYREIAQGRIFHFKEFHCVFSFRPWKHKCNYIYNEFNIHNIAFSTPSPPRLDFYMIIRIPWHNSPPGDQGTRVPSLSWLHDNSQTHQSWLDSSGRVISPTQRPVLTTRNTQ